MKKPTRNLTVTAGRRPAPPVADVPKARDRTARRSTRDGTEQKIGSEREFRPLKDEIIKADARGRITVGSEASERQFRIMINDDGQILLDPVVVIPEREAWLFRNPQAATSVLRGIEQSKAGKTKSLGSFEEFADADDES